MNHTSRIVADQASVLFKSILLAEDAGDLERVVDLLDLLSPLWDAVDEPLQASAVRNRLRSRALYLRNSDEDFLSRLRKNAACRARTTYNISRLKHLEAL